MQCNFQAEDVVLIGRWGGADTTDSACVSIYTPQKSPTLIPHTQPPPPTEVAKVTSHFLQLNPVLQHLIFEKFPSPPPTCRPLINDMQNLYF